jgi:hypothetical protein
MAVTPLITAGASRVTTAGNTGDLDLRFAPPLEPRGHSSPLDECRHGVDQRLGRDTTELEGVLRHRDLQQCRRSW